MQNGKKFKKDITGWLLKAYAGEAHPEDDPTLQGDARLFIVAGSDTTSATLTYLFYHLTREPDQIEKLKDELRPLTQETGVIRTFRTLNISTGLSMRPLGNTPQCLLA